ncbi:hypothetical protein LTS08_006625 [Lithohypha guttulata]|uniref:Uncharacterized protein n=2 Tax=Lithohypha guttulata TaxID=1690604 RepID=A0AAN7T103_9EURO|nr:hypothetical protein LTR24_009676 [Lithohypha guttulata]KAK5078791.1 hypothetical protein LTR51_000982 [Lithohypha guttulata]KAK5085983.1 hypothetical protein LTR05_005273 [Lithohypha guttulata]KAK5097870.1 hypothetical protein LTS08_006625 [Lithohypha guttulata]KAK5310052.1 hypothetical protein LTR70_009786 [Exophiala xenobiotica]
MTFESTDVSLGLEETPPLTVELSSTNPTLRRLILEATDLSARVAKNVTEEEAEIGQAGDTQACQAAKQEIDMLYTVLLKTAMHLKPSTKSDLQKYLPPLLPALFIPARPPSADREDAFMSGTIATSGTANVKMPTSLWNLHLPATPPDDFDHTDTDDAIEERTQTRPNDSVVSKPSGRCPASSNPEQSQDSPGSHSPPLSQPTMHRPPWEDLHLIDAGRNDKSDTRISPLSTSEPCSPNQQPSEDKPTSRGQQPLEGEGSKVPARAPSFRSAAREARDKLAGQATPCPRTSRKRKARNTSGAKDLYDIVAQLGGREVQEIMQEAKPFPEQPQQTSHPLRRLGVSSKSEPLTMSLVAQSVQRVMQHSSSQWINAVLHRFDVVFLHRFYLAAKHEVSVARVQGRPSVFIEESAKLLQMHGHHPTKPQCNKVPSVVLDRLTDFACLGGPETNQDRESIRTKLGNVQQLGKRWQYLVDHVNEDVLVLFPPSVNDYRSRHSLHMNDQTVKWLAGLLQDRRKSLSAASPEILKLAELALEKTFRSYSRRQEEIFGGAGRLLRVPRPLGDKDKSDGGSDDGNDDGSDNESHDEDGDGEDNISQTLDSPSTGESHRSENGLRYCKESCTESGASITADGAEVYGSDAPAATSSTWPVHRQRLSDIDMDGPTENELAFDGMLLSDDMLPSDDMFDKFIDYGLSE